MKATKILSLAILLLATTACTLGDRDETPRPENIGYSIARTAVAHLSSVHMVLEDILLYEQMLTIEDDTERNAFKEEHFERMDSCIINGNLHEVYRTYSSNPTRIITDGKLLREGGYWEVKRENTYDFTIQATTEGVYTFEFAMLYTPSTTSQNLKGKIVATPGLEEGQTIYTAPDGLLSVGEEDNTYNDGKRYPLNLEITITEPVVYDANMEAGWFTAGAMHLECYDTLYGTTDIVDVTLKERKGYFTYLNYSGDVDQPFDEYNRKYNRVLFN